MRSFLDTNVLVYLFDDESPAKKRKAREIYESEVTGGGAALSTQVLQEFYVSVTRKLGKPLGEEDAAVVVRDLATLPIVQVDPPMILSAISRSREIRISFWDALIIEAAIASGATRLLSEDLQDGLEIGGIRVENPFRSTSESSSTH